MQSVPLLSRRHAHTVCLHRIFTGLQRVRALCQIIRVKPDIEEQAKAYFSKAYQHQSFINVSLQKKEALGGCCVLVSCRLLNWPLTMATISSLLEADPTMVGGVYQEMIKILNIQTPIVNITDVVEAHCQE